MSASDLLLTRVPFSEMNSVQLSSQLVLLLVIGILIHFRQGIKFTGQEVGWLHLLYYYIFKL